MIVRRTKAEREAVYNPSPERVAELLTPPCSCHELRAENDRLTEENRALVAYIELIDPKRDWRIEEIEKMRNEPEVREGRLVIQPILARHREEASR